MQIAITVSCFMFLKVSQLQPAQLHGSSLRSHIELEVFSLTHPSSYLLLRSSIMSFLIRRPRCVIAILISNLPHLLTASILKWLVLGGNEWRLSLHVSVMIEYVYDYVDDKPGFEHLLPTTST